MSICDGPAVHPANPTPEWERAFVQPHEERYVFAGCYTCSNGNIDALWQGNEALGAAETHFQTAGHHVWRHDYLFREWGKPDA